MNHFKGLQHEVPFYNATKDGARVTKDLKKPVGMSGRQWKKYNKEMRRKAKAKGAATVTVQI